MFLRPHKLFFLLDILKIIMFVVSHNWLNWSFSRPNGAMCWSHMREPPTVVSFHLAKQENVTVGRQESRDRLSSSQTPPRATKTEQDHGAKVRRRGRTLNRGRKEEQHTRPLL